MQWQIAAPGGLTITGSIPLNPGQRDYKFTYQIPAGAPGGTWTVTLPGIYDGLEAHTFHTPKVRTFQVIANPDLVLPTSATIAVNPSQQQLLRRAARNLQFRIEELKAAVASYEAVDQRGRIPQVLRTNVNDALKALQLTEADFKSEATADNQADNASVFFGDLRLNYDDVLRNLDRSSGKLARPAGFTNAAYSGKTPYALIVQASLRAFERNQLAYNIVAESRSLTFDLKVTSNPSGAAVSYYRRGDPPHPYADPTTAVIPSLVYAVWYVRIEKPGYKPLDREHDPFHSADHVVNVELSK